MPHLRVTGPRDRLDALRDHAALRVLHPTDIPTGSDGAWSVDVLGDPADIPHGLSVTLAATAPPDPQGYRDSAAIDAALAALAKRYPDACRHGYAPHRTHEGRRVGYLRIRTGSDPKPAVVLVGGMHAREWAPPEALVSLAESLLTGTLIHPAFTRAGARYAEYAVPATTLSALRAGLDIVVLPLANPDGRDFTLRRLPSGTPDPEIELHRWWRKNRRPAPGGDAASNAGAVDLNRNLAVCWDYTNYYTQAAASKAACSTDPASDVFIGPAAASEPETLNVQWLLDEHPPAFFCDVHSYSRDVMYPWGCDTDQSRDESQSWRNPDWDRTGPHGGRDGGGGRRYGEYLPEALRRSHKALAERMAKAAGAQAGADPIAARRSAHIAKTELGLYPTTGTTTDYVLGAWQKDPSRPVPHCVAMECGQAAMPHDPDDDDGGFHPPHATALPKVEREVHAALLELLTTAHSA